MKAGKGLSKAMLAAGMGAGPPARDLAAPAEPAESEAPSPRNLFSPAVPICGPRCCRKGNG